MGQRIEIRSLIARKPSAEDTAAGKLPAAVEKTLPVWELLGRRFGEALEDLLGAELETEVELSLVTETDLRMQNPRPGAVLPLSGGAAVMFPGSGARVFSDHLLRVPSTEDAIDVENIDCLLVQKVAEEMLSLCAEGFGFAFVPSGDVMTDWPLTAPAPAARLMASCTVKTAEGPPAVCALLFPDEGASLFEETVKEGRTRTATEALPLRLSGVLGRWTARLDELGAVAPGAVITIPGGDLSEVRLELSDRKTTRLVGSGELGTIRGRHAVKVTETAQPA